MKRMISTMPMVFVGIIKTKKPLLDYDSDVVQVNKKKVLF
jgi:hypothetical protein